MQVQHHVVLAGHSDIDWIAVQPITRSIMTMQEPSCLANSPRRYISSIVPAVMLR